MSQQLINPKHYIKVEMNGAIANISINNIPFIKNLDTDGFITTEPVNLWLKDGVNTLSFDIYPDEESENYSPIINASIFIHDEKHEIPTPLETIATLKYTSEQDSEYPINKNIMFTNRNSVKTKLWNNAEKINRLSDKDKSEMLNIIKTLSESILKDTKLAIRLQQFKLQDDALAEDKTVKRLEEVALKSYEWLRSQKGLKIDDINSDEIQFNICGNNYVINIMRKNNEEAIIIESDEMFFDIGIYFAKINGNWTIVR